MTINKIRWGTRIALVLAWCLLAYGLVGTWRFLAFLRPEVEGSGDIVELLAYRTLKVLIVAWVTWRLWVEVRFPRQWGNWILAALPVFYAGIFAAGTWVTYS